MLEKGDNIKFSLLSCFVFFIIFSCSDQTIKTDFTNSLEVGNTFIKATLNGDFKNINQLYIPNKNSDTYLKLINLNYSNKNREERKLLRTSSIVIDEFNTTKVDTNILYFHTSLDSTKKTIYLIKENNNWKILINTNTKLIYD